MATMEFLQQEWISDGKFIGIGNERDPIIGRQEEGASFHDSDGYGKPFFRIHRATELLE
jgi:hypothetical protein